MKEDRLQNFENMLEDIIREYKNTIEQMQDLKKQGKERSVTFRQLMTNKLLYQRILPLYKENGLISTY